MFKLKVKKENFLEGGFTQHHFSYLKKSDAGFTLVEMITAVAIFALVMTMAMGSLLTVLNANKQNQAIQTAVNNLNLALEMMSREIRVGSKYHCGSDTPYTTAKDCTTGGSFISFLSYEGNQVIYKWVDDDGVGRIARSEDGGASFLYLTSKGIDLEQLTFYVKGTDLKPTGGSDDIQPRVLISVGGYVDLGSVGDRGKSHFDLQTTVSQRLIDF